MRPAERQRAPTTKKSHSLQHVWHTPLLSSSAFPAPTLPASCLVVCVCSLVLGVFFSFVQFPLPSLRREKSGAQFVARVFSGVPISVVDVVSLARKKLCLLR